MEQELVELLESAVRTPDERKFRRSGRAKSSMRIHESENLDGSVYKLVMHLDFIRTVPSFSSLEVHPAVQGFYFWTIFTLSENIYKSHSEDVQTMARKRQNASREWKSKGNISTTACNDVDYWLWSVFKLAAGQSWRLESRCHPDVSHWLSQVH